METKTKEGKYFSQLGSWGGLIKVIVLVLIIKIFGFTLLGLVIFAITAVFMIWVPYAFKSKVSVTDDQRNDFSLKI